MKRILLPVIMMAWSCGGGDKGSNAPAVPPPVEEEEEKKEEEEETPAKNAQLNGGSALSLVSDIPTEYTFTIESSDEPLTCSLNSFSLTSSNTNVFHPNDAVFAGTAPNCKLEIVSRAQTKGTAELTIQAKDFSDTSAVKVNVDAEVSLRALGQPNDKTVQQIKNGLNSPVGFVKIGTKYYLSDLANFRILGYNELPSSTAAKPDFVISQPDLSSTGFNRGGTVGRNTNGGAYLSTDGTRLFAAEPSNNRVLIWNTAPQSDSDLPDVVLGQDDFESGQANRGVSANQSSLNDPYHAFAHNNHLYVADYGNNRVMVWNPIPTTSGADASFVLGQANFTDTGDACSATTLKGPQSIGSDGTKIFVADMLNNRVLGWNTAPSANGAAADFALGQADRTTCTYIATGSITASTMRRPNTVYVESDRMIVGDNNANRYMLFNSVPSSDNAAANVIIGNSSATAYDGGPTQNFISTTAFPFREGSKLFLPERGANRILVYNSWPTSHGQNADFVLGQPSFTESLENNFAENNYELRGISGAFSDGNYYITTDTIYHRILIWQGMPTATNSDPKVVIGQPDFVTHTSGTTAQAFDKPHNALIAGGKLFVADHDNNRALIFDEIPTSNHASASVVLGQLDKTSGTLTTSQNRTRNVSHVFSDGEKVVVSDEGSHRVLIWNSIPTTDGANADVVLGQANWTDRDANRGSASPAANTLGDVAGTTIADGKLIVCDMNNHRVLIWNSVPTSNGVDADVVLGQADFTSKAQNNGGLSARSLSWPTGVTVKDGALYVVDSLNHRVLKWDSIPQSNNQAANKVYGQKDFVSNAKNGSDGVSWQSFNKPFYISSFDGGLMVSDRDNFRSVIIRE